MKAITLRNLPPEVVKIVRKKARKKGTSINKAVISLLEESTGTSRKKQEKKTLYHDLDALAGSWTREEALEFEKALAAQRTIEPDLWK
ncbi:MAG: hypothetical protein HYV04_18200 [Deltaproteobacteria bacterium]|nr:hypothetical protein [Deltaproteobacteria bacterium]